MDTYTHGHAEPVLQSHRWRTAENSGGLPAAVAGPGLDLLDVGCGPGHHHRRPRRPRRARPRARASTSPPTRWPRPAGCGRARRASTSPSRSATSTRSPSGRRLVRRRARPPGAAAPDRSGGRAARDGPRVPAGRGDRRAGRRLRGDRLVPGRTPASTGGWTSTGRWPGATAPSPTPAGGCCRGRTRPGCATSSPRPVVLVLRDARRARVVGDLVGRAVDVVGLRRPGGRATGWPRQDELAEIAAAWLRWAATPTTAGSACCTANCSSGSDRRIGRLAHAWHARSGRQTPISPCCHAALAGGVGLDGGAHVLRQAGRDLLVVGGEPLVLDVHPARARRASPAGSRRSCG